MHELLNLYLFAYCIWKVLWMTGLGEGLILVYAATRWQRAFGVPAPRRFARGRVIEFKKVSPAPRRKAWRHA
jgi:hypothetical protein